MMAVSMSSMPPKVIGRKACSQVKGPSWLLKDLGPKRCPNIQMKEESKEIRDVMKV
jgi:hypothetical protein